VSTPTVTANDRVRFRVLHEDDDIVVVIKPAGVVTQPGVGHERDSLLSGLFARHGAELQRLGAARDFGLVHRLDRETSGLLVVALRAHSYDHLRDAFASRRIGKYYWAIVRGAPRSATGVVRRPIAEVQARRAHRGQPPGPTMKLARVAGNGKPAVTAYRVLSAGKGGALVECRTLTGRLHQVRVHLESIGCPILGDGLYGPTPAGITPRLALHAHRLVLPHPRGMTLDCRTAWPSDLRAVLSRFGLERPAGSDAVLTRAPRVEGEKELDDDGVGDEEPGVRE